MRASTRPSSSLVSVFALCLATLGGAVAARADEESAEQLERVGVDAFTRHDYDTAVEKLGQAKKAGGSVDAELAEARFFQAMWNGLQAEANGFKPKATQFYEAAAEANPGKPGPKVALKRVKDGAAEAEDSQLATIDNTDERALDFRQRIVTKLLKVIGNRDVDVRVQSGADYSLGTGMDGLSGAARQKILSGTAEETPLLMERLVATESDSAATSHVEVDQSVDASMKVEYGKFGYGAHASGALRLESSGQATTNTNLYCFKLWYEVVTKKRVLRSPQISLDSPVLLGDWLDNYGTHYVSEVLEGGWVQILLTKECQSAEEKAKIAQQIQGAIGGNTMVVSGEVAGQKSKMEALEAARVEAGLSLRAESAGAGGTFSANSIASFLAKQADFKKEVVESKAPTIVRVKGRSYAAPEVKGFPFTKDRFSTLVKRLQARALSEGLMGLVRASGRSKLLAQGIDAGGDGVRWDPRKKRARKAGERYAREDSQVFEMSFKAPGQEPTVLKPSNKYRSVHRVLEASGADKWKESVFVETWEQVDHKGISDTSLKGHTVVVECHEGRRSFKLDDDSSVTSAGVEWVKKELAGSDPSSNPLYPNIPVGAKSSWICDVHEVIRSMAATFECDESESSAKGKMTSVKTENGAPLGHIEVEVDLKVKGLSKDLPFVEGGHFKMSMTGDLSLQVQESRARRIKIPMKLIGVLRGNEGVRIQYECEGQMESREEDLPPEK